MKKYLTTLLAACCMLAAFSMPASALEYHFDGPDAGLFGRPTSDDTIYVTMDKPANTDRSKNAAYIPPAFGSPTSYTLNAGELLHREDHHALEDPARSRNCLPRPPLAQKSAQAI